MRDLQSLMDKQQQWSDNTFNDGKFTYRRAFAIAHHLQKEARELTEAVDSFLIKPSDQTADAVHEELADVFLLVLDCAAHVGVSAASLMLYAEQKHEKNTKKEWVQPDTNGVVEHIRK
ncbi:MAG: dATP/dGTP pyrophosphohydrolase domain-containing protein [Bacteroidales bacterium]